MHRGGCNLYRDVIYGPRDQTERACAKNGRICSQHQRLTTRTGRDAWLMVLPDPVRNIVTRRDNDCKNDLRFIFDALKQHPLETGDWVILILIDEVIKETRGLAIQKWYTNLRRDLKACLSSQPLFLNQVDNSLTPAVLISELDEWKRVHHEVQMSLNELDIYWKDLYACRYKFDREKLDDIGYGWQSRCIPVLKDIPDRWKLQYAQSPSLDNLREQTGSLFEMTSLLMSVEDNGYHFKQLCLRFGELRGTFWDALNTADGKILVLITHLRSRI
jgi:hypothetical protein